MGTFTEDLGVTFAAAQPDTIFVDPGRFAMHATDSTTITATTIRRVGKVADGTILGFEAFDPTGAPVGQIRTLTATTSSVATALFKPSGIAVTTNVTLKVTTLDRSRVGTYRLVVTP